MAKLFYAPCFYCDEFKATVLDVHSTSSTLQQIQLYRCKICQRSRGRLSLLDWYQKFLKDSLSSQSIKIKQNLENLIYLLEKYPKTEVNILLVQKQQIEKGKWVNVDDNLCWQKLPKNHPILNVSEKKVCAKFDAKEYSLSILNNDVDPLTGWTSIHLSVWYGNEELLIFLLRQGYDPNTKGTIDGLTSIQIAKQITHHPLSEKFVSILKKYSKIKNNK